ncbi:MAG: HD domain-containing protein, partial [Nitrososphaeria archaeon]
MSNDELFEKIRKRSEEFYKHSHHDRFHVERVYNLAVRIAKEEDSNVDLDVVKAAALLHDVARSMEDEGKIKDHAIEGAKIARRILKEVGFPEAKIEKVVYCIMVHRYRNNLKPEIIEAQILQDADRLDMLG